MADFVIWVTAAEGSFAWKPGTFLNVYERNKEQSLLAAHEGNPLILSIGLLLTEESRWQGTMTDLLYRLQRYVPRVRAAGGLPRGAAALGKDLRRLAPVLRTMGAIVECSRQGGSGRRLVLLRKREMLGDFPSHLSHLPSGEE